MISQMQRSCMDCKGQGHTADTKTDRTIVEVYIEKGMKHNDKITFRGMADEIPGVPKENTGDVNFVIQEKEHPFFKRKGADLLITENISLNQALCGYSIRFNHLDDRDVILKTKPGQIIQSESTDPISGRSMPYMMMVPNEGMPSKGNPFVKGNLYIVFHIEFPQSLNKETVEALRTILPDPNTENDDYDPMEVEEQFLVEANCSDFGTGGDVAMSDAAYDTDDETNGRQNVQCQQS